MKAKFKIGVISDTHGFLDPAVPKLFEGVSHILHAGDIGPSSIIGQLEMVAPVTAVLGNNDSTPEFKLTELVELAGRKILLQHIVNPREPDGPGRRRLLRDRPNAVVFGHTHKPFYEKIKGVLFFNPGYAGKPRFNATRSVAIWYCSEREIRAEFLQLT